MNLGYRFILLYSSPIASTTTIKLKTNHHLFLLLRCFDPFEFAINVQLKTLHLNYSEQIFIVIQWCNHIQKKPQWSLMFLVTFIIEIKKMYFLTCLPQMLISPKMIIIRKIQTEKMQISIHDCRHEDEEWWSNPLKCSTNNHKNIYFSQPIYTVHSSQVYNTYINRCLTKLLNSLLRQHADCLLLVAAIFCTN